MKTAVNLEPLEAVRMLGPLIRHHAEQAERERRVAPPVLQAMQTAGLFRLLTPRSFGGLEVDPLTCAQTIEEVGRIDSAAAWALCNPNSVAWWCRRLPDEGIEEIYAGGPDTSSRRHFIPPWRRRPHRAASA